MNELSQAVVIGVLVYIISQYVSQFILEPIVSFRKLLSEISHTVLLNQAVILSGTADNRELHCQLAQLSARLRSSVYLIPFFSVMVAIKLFGLPERSKILHACHELNRLTDGVISYGREAGIVSTENEKALMRLAELLPIETTYRRKEEAPKSST